jgi:hypothetical protein
MGTGNCDLLAVGTVVHFGGEPTSVAEPRQVYALRDVILDPSGHPTTLWDRSGHQSITVVHYDAIIRQLHPTIAIGTIPMKTSGNTTPIGGHGITQAFRSTGLPAALYIVWGATR